MMTERQQHRQYIEKTMKHLEDWEENLLKREQSFDRNKLHMQTQYERYTRKYDELQVQAERATTAWQRDCTDSVERETRYSNPRTNGENRRVRHGSGAKTD